MTNKTVTLPRELVASLQEKLDPHRDAVLWGAVCAALANQHIVCSNGILCQNSKCPECGGNGSYTRAALAEPAPPEECVHDFRMFSSECAKCGADWIPGKDYSQSEPVPPAGGDSSQTKIKPVFMLRAERLWGKDGEYAVTTEDHEWVNGCRKIGGDFPVYSGEVVTRLQAEVAHLRQHKNDYMEAAEETRKALQSEVERLNGLLENQRQDRKRHTSQAVKHVDEIVYLQSELTKARELLAVEQAIEEQPGEETLWQVLDAAVGVLTRRAAPHAWEIEAWEAGRKIIMARREGLTKTNLISDPHQSAPAAKDGE